VNNEFDAFSTSLTQWVKHRGEMRKSGVGIAGIALAIMLVLLDYSAPGASFLGFSPGPFYSLVGASDSPTDGAVLQVMFDEPVGVDTFIEITSSDPTVLIISTGGVTVPAGQATATVPVSSFALGSVTLTASYNATVATAMVEVVSEIPLIPALNIEALPGMVRLEWTTNAVGFLLETNSTPTTLAGWGVFGSDYSILDTNYVVTNALSGPATFFRLHKP
jgi:hypothetical protein